MKINILIVLISLSFSVVNSQTKINKPISKSSNDNKITKSNAYLAADSLRKVNDVTGMPKRGFATDWITPKSVSISKIQAFSKIEWGIHFPDSLTEQIQAYIQEEAVNTSINPFDPEQIDIKAIIEFFDGKNWNLEASVFGFYFQDFNRDTKSSNLQAWNWEKIKTEDFFRIRFTPTKVGKWRVTTIVHVRGNELARMGAFEFKTISGKNKGFIKIAKDQTHFELANESFIPIGQNLTKPTCYLEKDSTGLIINDPFKCAACPCAGIEDWCGHLKELPLHPKAYITYLEELTNLKKSGANFFRMINFPFTFEIEYEKLGNYSNRMNCAWELDKLIEKAEKLDLKINFNLFVGYPILKSPYGVNLWDWYADGPNDQGYCYRSELGLNEPLEFITNPKAIKHFKNRLRYYIARYGYSTSIAILELMSEINSKFPNNPEEIYKWQREMVNFIKNDLKHQHQLIAVNYDGAGPDEAKGDLSFSLKNVDVMGHNIHRAGIYRSDLTKVVEKYKKYQKPIIFSEIGTGDTEIEKCDNQTEWLKDLWFSLFSGSASTGINWNLQHDYKTWNNFKFVRSFLGPLDLTYFPTNSSQIRKDKLAEMICLIDSTNQKSIGVIQNATWNYYTKGSGACKTINKPALELSSFKNVASLKGKKGLELKLKPKPHSK
jgi:hypothetical protein